MNAETLIRTLQGVHPKARVILSAMPRQQEVDNGTGTCSGDVIYISVAEVDGIDTLVTLSNCVADRSGDLIFKARPQFRRFRVSTQQGVAAAAADLQEQLACEPTHDLETHLEVSDVMSLFRALDPSNDNNEPA